MEIYMVGGAVRDKLLGLPVNDRDWVVVGATAEQMKAAGYKQVGKDFPVFLHPETHEEYALARTERKTAPGYKGFQVHASPDVTLIEDLQRRDLTINAIAEAADGTLIDPFGGIDDLKQRILHHISPAFSEDPVRILRVARLTSYLAGCDFQVADETMHLMKGMVENGEADALVPERVWVEVDRALGHSRPSVFFEILHACDALKRLFPEIDCLYGVPQNRQYHPEIDSGKHAMMALDKAAQLSDDKQVRFAALVHDVGKGTTPAEVWPKHIGHEKRSVEIIRSMCKRLRVPNDYRDLAILVARYHTHCHRAGELRPATLLETLEALDAFRKPHRLEQFLIASEADSTARPGFEKRGYPQAEIFRRAYQAALAVTAKPLLEQGLDGKALARELHNQRVIAIAEQR